MAIIRSVCMKVNLLINLKPKNKVVFYLSFSEQCEVKRPSTFKAKPDSELIINNTSVDMYKIYLIIGYLSCIYNIEYIESMKCNVNF
ncbi:hypothetical protein RhiirA4_466487 [Rhizophagus irregularis]|uniref:Uncharacterized protein n=1 Tax=Rhizophagus irregularis TaxID=588596 RepID=A0A2I1GU37_9GLOM|nr:hypothetical protein RhiirA4_466487 [Rhizophagus irregularis]